MTMPLLIDVSHCCEHHTNEALEHLHKAIGEGDPDLIWDQHPSPLIRRIVELFTQRGLSRLDAVRAGILRWQSGANFRPGNEPVTPPGMMQRWSSDELALAKLYLESLPPAQWSIDDHMMAIDVVVQTYMPHDQTQTEAEWLSVRSSLMGKVQANMDVEPTEKQADKIAQAMPTTIDDALRQFGISGRFRQSMEFSRASACENVRAVTDTVRHRMRVVVQQDQQQRASGDPLAGSSLETKLLDEFGALNRDWRRIAVTEAGEAMNQGLIASLHPGTHVKRIEQYRGACPFCRKIDGMVLEVVAADAPHKDGWKQVWPGKNNIGRSAAPRKRVGGVLVDRTPDEMYWPPAGTAHPHCRGRWIVVNTHIQPDDDAEFAAELAALLA